MTTIKGTPAAVNAVAAIRDKGAGCPQPYFIDQNNEILS